MEHRKKRKTRKCKLKLGKTLAEIAEKNVPRITGITRIRQAKAWFEDEHEWVDAGTFFSHELPRIIREWLARVLMSRRKRGKRRFYYPLSTLNSVAADVPVVARCVGFAI